MTIDLEQRLAESQRDVDRAIGEVERAKADVERAKRALREKQDELHRMRTIHQRNQYVTGRANRPDSEALYVEITPWIRQLISDYRQQVGPNGQLVLSRLCGITARTLREIEYGVRKYMQFDTADRLFTALGKTELLAECTLVSTKKGWQNKEIVQEGSRGEQEG